MNQDILDALLSYRPDIFKPGSIVTGIINNTFQHTKIKVIGDGDYPDTFCGEVIVGYQDIKVGDVSGGYIKNGTWKLVE